MMTTAQLDAIESLLGRALTQEEITAIDACITDTNRNDTEITRVLSIGRTHLVKKNISKGDVLDAIGFDAGNALLDAVDSNPLFRHVKSELDRGDLDVSRPIVRQAIDAMAGNIVGFYQSDADTIKALAEEPNPLQLIDVSRMLNTAEGIPNGG